MSRNRLSENFPVYTRQADLSYAPPVVPSAGSRMMNRYFEFLAKYDRPEILDLGPVCGSNISFFLDRGSKLHVCDVFSPLARGEQQPAGPAERILSMLDYKESSLDGIHAWDLFDHLNDDLLSSVVPKLHALLKPHGLLIMLASNSSNPQPHPLFCLMNGSDGAVLHTATDYRLPFYHRSNRDIDRGMKPFRQANSFICTSGLREFMFKR